MATLPLILLAIFAVVFVVIVIVHQRNEAKRRESMVEMAESLGLTIGERLSPELESKSGHLETFNRGRSRKVTNVLEAETDRARLTLFDYQYTTGGGNNSQTHRLTIAAMESDDMRVPAFHLSPEGFWTKFGSMLGMQDIDFDSAPNFSNLFRLRGKDEAAIREFFDQRRLQFFEEHPGVSIEADDGVMIHYGARKKTDEMRDFMSQTYEIHRVLLPPGD